MTWQGGGYCYLAVWLDRRSRKIVSWNMRELIPKDLISEALPSAGLILHSNQGSQYTATRFQDLVAKGGVRQSMSRLGNCYNNAHNESF